MDAGTDVATLDEVPLRGSYLFTVADDYGNDTEVILVRCDEDPGVRAWVNRCPHESQRFDRGAGAPMRDGELLCPKHGSLFDACTGECDNGEAAGTALPAVDIAVSDGTVYLVDDDYAYRHAGASGDDGPGPSSSSHLSF